MTVINSQRKLTNQNSKFIGGFWDPKLVEKIDELAVEEDRNRSNMMYHLIVRQLRSMKIIDDTDNIEETVTSKRKSSYSSSSSSSSPRSRSKSKSKGRGASTTSNATTTNDAFYVTSGTSDTTAPRSPNLERDSFRTKSAEEVVHEEVVRIATGGSSCR